MYPSIPSLQLFMKATQLEKIHHDYEATKENLEEMKRGIDRKKQVGPLMWEVDNTDLVQVNSLVSTRSSTRSKAIG